MQVAVTDFTFPTLEIEQSILGGVADLVPGQCKTQEQLIPLVRQADVVLTQFAPINREVIDSMERARAIVRYGIGVDNVDLDAASDRGIPVCNVPDYCIDEVADHTLALILALTRQVIPNCSAVRSGKWGLAVRLEEMCALAQLTVGIAGFGRIGKEVVARLSPFKCARLVFDPVVPADVIQEAGCQAVSWEQMLRESDIVSLHCPSTASTRKMINGEMIRQMKPGALLVNVSRGDLVDTSALVDALQKGTIRAAALDVCDPEPIPPGHPLLSMDNVIATAHIASVSPRAVRRLRETAAQTALAALLGKPLPNVVNRSR